MDQSPEPRGGHPAGLTLTSAGPTAGGRTAGTPTIDAYQYDTAGDTTTLSHGGNAQNLTWDAEGHLASDTGPQGVKTNYLYDADGNLLLRSSPTVSELLLGSTELVENHTGSSDTVTSTRYYSFAGHNIGTRTSGGSSELLWITLDDKNGTPSTEIDHYDQVRKTQIDPFGAVRQANGIYYGDKGLADGTKDAGTGLTNIGARDYDPATGRFISVDPELNPTDPQSMNGYAYADNTPVTGSDPTGLHVILGDGTGGAADDEYGDGTSTSHGGGTASFNSPVCYVNQAPVKKSSRCWDCPFKSAVHVYVHVNSAATDAVVGDGIKLVNVVPYMINSFAAGNGGTLPEDSREVPPLALAPYIPSWKPLACSGAGCGTGSWMGHIAFLIATIAISGGAGGAAEAAGGGLAEASSDGAGEAAAARAAQTAAKAARAGEVDSSASGGAQAGSKTAESAPRALDDDERQIQELKEGRAKSLKQPEARSMAGTLAQDPGAVADTFQSLEGTAHALLPAVPDLSPGLAGVLVLGAVGVAAGFDWLRSRVGG